MPEADAKQATAAPRLLANLPPAEQSAAAIRETARKLGLLVDLHRIAARLRAIDAKKAGSSS